MPDTTTDNAPLSPAEWRRLHGDAAMLACPNCAVLAAEVAKLRRKVANQATEIRTLTEILRVERLENKQLKDYFKQYLRPAPDVPAGVGSGPLPGAYDMTVVQTGEKTVFVAPAPDAGKVERLVKVATSLMNNLPDCFLESLRSEWGHTNVAVIKHFRDALREALREWEAR